jgi:hypothetical protein
VWSQTFKNSKHLHAKLPLKILEEAQPHNKKEGRGII